MRYKDVYLSGYVAAIPGANPETRPTVTSKPRRRRRLSHRLLLAMITGAAYPLTRIDTFDSSTTEVSRLDVGSRPMGITLSVKIRLDESVDDAVDLAGGIVEASPLHLPRDIQTAELDGTGKAELALDTAGTYRVSYTKNLDGAALLADDQVVVEDRDVQIELVARFHDFS